MMRRIIMTALVLILAACTSQPDANSEIASAQSGAADPTGESPGGGGGDYDPVGLAKCLREQGIPADDPGPGQEKPRIPESVPDEQVDAAMKNCKQFAPDYGKPVPPPDPAQLETLRKFAQCMRAQGVDWPDPDPRTGRPVEADAPETPRDPGQAAPNGGPDQARAIRVCGEQVPGAGISVDPEPSTPKVEVPGQ